MKKYHINDKTGRANICDPVKTGVCKFGSNVPHFQTKDEAKAHYEKVNKPYTLNTLKKSGSTRFKKFAIPEHVNRFITKMQSEYDPAKIQDTTMTIHDISPMNFDKPFGGLWFSSQDKKAVEYEGDRAGTNWSQILGDGLETLSSNPDQYYYDLKLDENAKILSIDNREEYTKLLEEYGFIPVERYPERTNYTNGHKRKVDWERFAKDYDGIYITFNAISENNLYGNRGDSFTDSNATLEMWDIETLWICNKEVANLERF